MTAVAALSVIPPLRMPERGGHDHGSPAAKTQVMPVARLATRRARETRYGLAAVDHRGRIADVALIRALGWSPERRLDIQESGQLVLVTASPRGVFRVTNQGYVHLPLTVRRWCGLHPGDRVLLVAEPAEGLLVVHPPAALDAMVNGFHATVLGGGQHE